MISFDLPSLETRCQELDAQFLRVAERLGDAVHALQQGCLPEAGLVAELEALRERFALIAGLVHGSVHSNQLAGLADLRDALGRLRVQNEQHLEQMRHCRERLAKVLALRRQDRVTFPALERCHDIARRLLAVTDVPSSPHPLPELVDLGDGRHWLAALLRLVEEGDRLTDDQCAVLEDEVSAAFEGAGVLATAAVRGRLSIQPSPESVIAHPSEILPALAESPVNEPVSQQTRAALTVEPSATLEPITSGNAVSPTPTPPVTTAGAETALLELALTTTPEPTQEDIGAEVTVAEELEQAAAPGDPVEESFPSELLTRAADAAWRLVGDGRVGLAYQLAACLSDLPGGEATGAPPVVTLRALALSSLVRYATGEPVELLRPCIESLEIALRDEHALPLWQRQRLRLLLFGLCLRPSLLAPLSDASALLRAVTHELDEVLSTVRQLGQAILDYTQLGLALTPSILKGVMEHAAWAERRNALQAEALTWLNTSRQTRIKYDATTKVWWKWLEDDQVLGRLLRAVIHDDRRSIPWVKDVLPSLGKYKDVQKQLNSTDQKLRGRNAMLRPIEGDPRTLFFDRVQDAVAWGNRWLNLLDEEPATLHDVSARRADECRSAVLHHLPGARAQMAGLSESQDPATAAGTLATLRCLNDLEGLLDPKVAEVDDDLRPRHVLQADLLRLRDLELVPETWEPSSSTSATRLRLLLPLADESAVDWESLLRRCCEAGDHISATRVLELLRARPMPDLDMDALETLREESLAQWGNLLKSQIRQTHHAVNHAAYSNLLSEAERNRYEGDISGLSANIRAEDDNRRKDVDFRAAQKPLREILDNIGEQRKSRIVKVSEQLQETPLERERPETFSRIRAALDQGNFQVAEELFHRAKEGQSDLRMGLRLDVFGQFFPGFVRAWSEFADARSVEPREAIRFVTEGKDVGPLQMAGLDQAEAAEAGEMLRAWAHARSAKATNHDLSGHLTTLLTCLGFEAVQLVSAPGTPPAKARRFDLTVSPLADRNRCPIPQFGSDAGGRYRILCLWEWSSVDDVLRLAEQSDDRSLVVLFFDRLSETRRRNLAEACRDKERAFLVFDETLLYFLCGQPRPRLPALFQCSFPFTVANPYRRRADGVLPTEMFFGRSRQAAKVLDPTGTNFVFGGRQLGKTALLRQVERQSHAPARGVLVKYIDLKNDAHIGVTRPIGDIWEVICIRLAELGVVRRQQNTFKSLSAGIKAWLDRDARHRILLLLDEADAFFDSDSKKVNPDTGVGFPTLTELKGLMNDTGNRFKAVFAGLHNVQRTYRQSNALVAFHLGEAVCIGPLLDDNESLDAMELVRLPVETLGYRFETEDLPLLIMSQTNFYPSLIQLYCDQLLSHLTGKRRLFDARTSPPYKVTTRHLEDAYQSKDLRQAILERFTATLVLDPRYEFLAFCIAYACVEPDLDNAMGQGVDASWVREQAMYFWETGFRQDSSLETFKTLLEEMIGLGVLRSVGPNRYTLRSPNVLTLLGTGKEINDKLTEFVNREAPPVNEANSFRRIAGPHENWLRSPLTAQQEGELLAPVSGVSVISGSHLACLHDVIRFLRLACLTAPLHDLSDEPPVDSKALMKRLKTVFEGPEGVRLVLVPVSSSWDETWLTAALRLRRSPKKFVRVVFLADPGTSWRLERAAGAGVTFESDLRLRPCPTSIP